MKFGKFAPLGATMALAFATPALAQDAGGVDWTGPYVGGSFGYTFQKKDGAEHLRFDTDGDGAFDDQPRLGSGAPAFSPGTCGGAARGRTPAAGCSGDKDAIGWMGHVGYDMQFGSIVAGIVGEAGKSYISDSVTEFSTNPASYTFTRRIDWNANLRARLGYTTPGGVMPYITGGLAYAKVKNAFRQDGNGNNTFTPGNAKEDAWGWTMGGGLEAKVAPNFSIGARYLWTRYKANDYTVVAGPNANPAVAPTAFNNGFTNGQTVIGRGDKFDTQSVMATASFRF
ncbi:porin family protein [Sphingobium amiense]|uniref:Porin family protein n=1 Tax=Sphingobium amiense TaxID=135719 RepID=A0A494W429_9SPHN|nr:outer membrane beta-barrel protein [Sphingobium amiense]BBD97928.1 porin family protein [Sphingobium amiense]